MSYQNVARQLDFAVAQGYTLSGQTHSVVNDALIDKPGSYYVDASAGPITLTISVALNNNGMFINVKKIDETSNKVTILAPSNGTIDGHTEVVLVFPYENLQIQHHKGKWYIL